MVSSSFAKKENMDTMIEKEKLCVLLLGNDDLSDVSVPPARVDNQFYRHFGMSSEDIRQMLSAGEVQI